MAIVIAQAANIPQLAVLLAGAAAVAGHNWPVFIGFRGGRGESTTIGVLLTVITQPMLIVGGVATVVLFITRNVILASAFLFIPATAGMLVAGGSGAPGWLWYRPALSGGLYPFHQHKASS